MRTLYLAMAPPETDQNRVQWSYLRYAGIGVEFFAGLAALTILGVFLDGRLGTSPILDDRVRAARLRRIDVEPHPQRRPHRAALPARVGRPAVTPARQARPPRRRRLRRPRGRGRRGVRQLRRRGPPRASPSARHLGDRQPRGEPAAHEAVPAHGWPTVGHGHDHGRLRRPARAPGRAVPGLQADPRAIDAAAFGLTFVAFFFVYLAAEIVMVEQLRAPGSA